MKGSKWGLIKVRPQVQILRDMPPPKHCTDVVVSTMAMSTACSDLSMVTRLAPAPRPLVLPYLLF